MNTELQRFRNSGTDVLHLIRQVPLVLCGFNLVFQCLELILFSKPFLMCDVPLGLPELRLGENTIGSLALKWCCAL